MASVYENTITQYYMAFYGRPADPAGLAYWSAQLEAAGGNGSAIIAAFASSPEAQQRFGNTSVSDRVTQIYQSLFGRNPDTAGLDHWVGEVQTGQVSVADVALAILNGAQNDDRSLINTRMSASLTFTAEVQSHLIQYSGSVAAEAASLLLPSISSTTSSFTITKLVDDFSQLLYVADTQPQVIQQLVGNGSLTDIFNTSAGQSDPQGLVESILAIANVAKTDSQIVTKLLEGDSSLAYSINHWPSGTTFTALTNAVDSGGLSSGGSVLHPTTTTTTVTLSPPIIPLVSGDHAYTLTGHTAIGVGDPGLGFMSMSASGSYIVEINGWDSSSDKIVLIDNNTSLTVNSNVSLIPHDNVQVQTSAPGTADVDALHNLSFFNYGGVIEFAYNQTNGVLEAAGTHATGANFLSAIGASTVSDYMTTATGIKIGGVGSFEGYLIAFDTNATSHHLDAFIFEASDALEHDTGYAFAGDIHLVGIIRDVGADIIAAKNALTSSVFLHTPSLI